MGTVIANSNNVGMEKGATVYLVTFPVNHSPAVRESQSIVLNRYICHQFYLFRLCESSVGLGYSN